MLPHASAGVRRLGAVQVSSRAQADGDGDGDGSGADGEAAAARELLQRLTHLWTSDPLIDELGVVLLGEGEGSFVCVEHKLGISFHCIPRLYQTALNTYNHVLQDTRGVDGDGVSDRGNNKDVYPLEAHSEALISSTRSVTLCCCLHVIH